MVSAAAQMVWMTMSINVRKVFFAVTAVGRHPPKGEAIKALRLVAPRHGGA